jgi:uncharacterized LabA/DUF88 family protein
MQKVIVYIDGFNFYHAIKSLSPGTLRNKYVNLWTLSEALLQPHQTLEGVKYFSAFAKWRVRSYPKHFRYVEQLRDAGVTPIMAHFKNKSKRCNSCGTTWIEHEEKETDIRIALALFEDAVDDKFDLAIIISADSDLVPVIEQVNSRFPNKYIFLAVPPKRYRFARDLIRVATTAKEITIGAIKRNLF